MSKLLYLVAEFIIALATVGFPFIAVWTLHILAG